MWPYKEEGQLFWIAKLIYCKIKRYLMPYIMTLRAISILSFRIIIFLYFFLSQPIGYVGAKILFFRCRWKRATWATITYSWHKHIYRRFTIFYRFPVSQQLQIADSKCQQGERWRCLLVSGMWKHNHRCK